MNTTQRAQLRGRYQARLLCHAAGLVGAIAVLPAAASAQIASAPANPQVDTAAGEAADGGEAIIVTGSRIVRDGNDAPTPVSVVSGEEISTEAPANIADFVNTLPSVTGSQTAVTNSGSLSNGQTGVSALNLRSLGQNRTLILIDGQRSVASTSTGLVDINTIPQALIERVEVVTGGASSVYGSDAVAGVVNFVLDTDFTGISADYEYGVTTYGDIPNHKVSMTLGSPFADDRGHVVVSAEYFTQEGQHTIDRDWNDSGYFQINNPAYTATNGLPQRLIQAGIGSSNFTPGGLITAGPRRGTYFGVIDPATGRPTLNQLAYGAISGQWMIGGDYDITSANHRSSNSLANDEDRLSLFGRAEYEFAPWFTLFGQASYNRFEGLSYYQQTPSVNVPIRSDNAFLPAALYNAAGTTTYTIGTSNAGIPAGGGRTDRQVERYVVGGNGDFDVGSMGWSWDGYYQYGKTTSNEVLVNSWRADRMNAAQDAVYDSRGNIVCRVNIDANPANDQPGCVPLNRIGIGGVTQDALQWLLAIYPERTQYIKQEVAGLNFATSNLFENWAGPVSLAFGGEWRKESVDGYTDENQYSTNPNLFWLYGNFRVIEGSYTVKEAYAELLFPLYDGVEFNGAVRVTDYSTSGTVTTWKAGLVAEPFDDLRLRGTVSRDIRAPNIAELFDPGTARTNSVNVPLANGSVRADEFVQNFAGNPLLDPEVAQTYGVGAVYTPSFAPGLALTVDYFDIEVEDAISQIGAQTTVNFCFEQAQQEFCDDINYAAPGSTDIVTIDITNYNFASQTSRGIDFEASYRRPVGPGELSLRALGTYTLENVTDNGIDPITDDAAGTFSLPELQYRFSVGYDMDSGFGASLVGRGHTGGTYDNDWIECTTGCPTFTSSTDRALYRTININDVPGAIYFDTNFNYDFELRGVDAQLLFAVKNVFDRDPELVGNGPDGNNTPAYPQTSRSRYDTFGRTFRMGLRVRY
ncbi:TonB-dependent receptor [Croceibacterium sp. TMG7-5b_MA50]|uniref:TonB-dependent receptor domain-containing protein n=1 Tax=Croceibacterium sp. TMG7-5b_MA50 TaxID=3121290 RepID=UPI00322178B9